MTRRRRFQLWAGYALMVASVFVPIFLSPFSAYALVDAPLSLVPPVAFGLLGLTLTLLLARPTMAWIPAATWLGGIGWLLGQAAPWQSYNWLYLDGFLKGFGFCPFGWVTAFFGALIVAIVSLQARRRGSSAQSVVATSLASVFE